MPLNFGPPVIDFSPLGQLGATYDAGAKRNREAEMNAARQKALAGFGQNSDLAALGKTLLQAGDLEGGMTALRLDAANKGTPWQREQAAAEAARAGATLAETKREHDAAEERARRAEERTTRPERVTGKDEFGDPKYGDRDPVTGAITWDDGTTTPGRGGRGTGPRSGGEDDPNLPPPNAQTAQLALSPQTSTDPGYVIPKTLQGYPPGTVLPPGGGVAPLAALAPPGAAGTDTAIAAPAAATAAPLAPPGVTGPTAVAQGPAAPPPPGAAPGQPTVPGPPITATQINQGTANIPPMTPQEMIAEAHRLGISPGQYRAARAAAIQKELQAKAGGPDPEKQLGEQAGKLAVAEQFLANAPKIREAIKSGDQTGLWDRTKAVNKWGEQGHIENLMEAGQDALIHMMTGAGMNESEAKRKVGRYAPTVFDTPTSLLAKHDQLVSELEHWRELAYRGRGQKGPLPPASPAYGVDTAPLELNKPRDLGGGRSITKIAD
jgi:hypothetical protein